MTYLVLRYFIFMPPLIYRLGITVEGQRADHNVFGLIPNIRHF